MTAHRWERAAPPDGDRHAIRPNGHDPSLGELLKRLSSDTSDLFRQEITLAKAEAGEIASNVRSAASRLAVALAFGLIGTIAFTAFAVIALGNALGGAFWLSSLIVALLGVAVAGLLAKRATAKVEGDRLKPTESMTSLRGDTAWAAREASEFKRDLTGANRNEPQPRMRDHAR